MPSIDSLNTRRDLKVGDKTYAYYSLPAAEEAGLAGVSRLPVSMKVLLENLLRNEDGRLGQRRRHQGRGRLARQQGLGRARDHLPPGARADAGLHRRAGGGRPRRHARRDGDAGRRPGEDQSADPGRPGHRPLGDGRLLRHAPSAFGENVEREYERNLRALPVPALGLVGLQQFPRRAARHRHLPPGQPRISGPDRLDRRGRRRRRSPIPDTLVGTDSHTTMVNGLAVLGWGVGGIEAEAAMLGQPISMLIPEVDRLQADRPAAGRRHRHRPGADRHPDAAQEGRGRQVRRVLRPGPRRPDARGPGDHRQHGAGIRRDLRLLPGRRRRPSTTSARTGRDAERVALVEAYAKAQGLWRERRHARPGVHRHAGARPRPPSCPSLAGPKRPQDRVLLSDAGAPPVRATALAERVRQGRGRRRRRARRSTARATTLGDGDVVIAAITSCTNTSNPCVLIAAGLVARKARGEGPEGQALGEDLAGARLAGGHRLSGQGRPAEASRRARLQPGRLRLHHLHRQFRPAAGGDLQGDRRTATWSSPRCSPATATSRAGSIPDTRANYLASPPLVVAYALAGTMKHRPRPPSRSATGKDGKPVYLQGHLADHRRRSPTLQRKSVTSEMFAQALRRRLQGRQALAGDQGRRRPDLRLGHRLDLRAEPALLRGHDA